MLALQCNPIAGGWNRGVAVTCLNSQKLFIGTAIPHTIIDILILVLPIPYIYRLQVNLKQKLLLAGIFLLGGFVCIVSVVRLVAILQTNYSSPDVSWNMTESVMWPYVELNVAVVCACLPSYKPLYYFMAGKPRAVSSPRTSFVNAGALDLHDQRSKSEPDLSKQETSLTESRHMKSDSELPIEKKDLEAD